MGRMAGAVSAIALMGTGLLVWSQAAWVTDAAGVAMFDLGALRRAEESPAAKVADRFPKATEMLQPFSFIQGPDATDPGRSPAPLGKGDRLPFSLGDCLGQDVFFSAECPAAAPVKPAAKPDRAVTIERRIAPDASELVRQPAAPVVPARAAETPARAAAIPAQPASVPVQPAVVLARATVMPAQVAVVPARAAIIPVQAAVAPTQAAVAPTQAAVDPARATPASCRESLATAIAGLERAATRAKSVRASENAETCASYRRDFFDVVKARQMTSLCKSGAERDQDLIRIDVTVESINGAIAKSCRT